MTPTCSASEVCMPNSVMNISLSVSEGAVVIVMAMRHIKNDEDLRNVRPVAEALVSEGKWEIVEDFQKDGYFSGEAGQVFVFRKL